MPAGDAGLLALAVDPEGLDRRRDAEQVLARPPARQIGGAPAGLATEVGAEAVVEAEQDIDVMAARPAGASRASPPPPQLDRAKAGEDVARADAAILARLAAGASPRRRPSFRRQAGLGQLIQDLARFQPTPRRIRAWRVVQIVESIGLVQELEASTGTGLRVMVIILDQVDQTGRKYAEGLKQDMKIVFDDILPKWDDRAVPSGS